jgi:hypothetical protein
VEIVNLRVASRVYACMRLIFLFFIAGCIPIRMSAQTFSMDSLSKYSYYVFGKQPTADGKSMQTVEGTCFFVTAGNKVFLVSSKHLMTGWSTSDAEKASFYPDTLFVRFAIPGGKETIDYPIDIRDIKAKVTGSFYYAEPDIFIMEFKDSGSIRMNTITDIDPQQAPAGTGASSLVYGFPKRKPFYLEGRLFSSPQENISYRDHKRDTAVSDKINYLIKCTGIVQGGYSGAPVFLKNDGTENWYFAGIVSQGVPGDNYFFVVKPLFLLQELPIDL